MFFFEYTDSFAECTYNNFRNSDPSYVERALVHTAKYSYCVSASCLGNKMVDKEGQRLTSISFVINSAKKRFASEIRTVAFVCVV